MCPFQCRRELQHGRDQHERDGERERRGEVVVARDLQVVVRHQRRVLPLRHSSLQDEVGVLDIRFVGGKSANDVTIKNDFNICVKS